MIFSKKKKVLSAVLSLAMIGTMAAAVPFSASADDTTTATPGVSYQVQGQTYGWQSAKADGELAGTVGQSKRLEAVKINLTGAPAGASITYQVQGQTYGWQSAKSDGALAGTVGQAKRLEAIKITLSGMPGYSVQYKVQGQTYGWQDWKTTENGTSISDAALAGTVGQAKRLEAIEIKIVPDQTPVTTPLAVSSVTASAANSVAVTFNHAPDDTSALAFAVANASSTAVPTTVTWSPDNTVATLTDSANFPVGSYTVDVKNGTTDLGSNTVSFSTQKVAKIVFPNNTLSVVPSNLKESDGTTDNPYDNDGITSYKVYDQYGVDITDTTLGNNLTWTVGIGTPDTALTKDGVLVIDPLKATDGTITTPLSFYQSATINVYDNTSYTQASTTMTVSQSAGTISNLTLNSLTSPNNDDFNAGDPYGQWYIDYTALDASGNSTNSYALLSTGILSVNGGAFLNCSVEKDTTNSANGVISVQINPSYAANVITDTPITITVLLTNGQSALLNVTLKKATGVDSISLSAPSTTVASLETATIPFSALDQYGNAVTSCSELQNQVTLNISAHNPASTDKGIRFVQNSDGTTSLTADLPADTTSSPMTVYVYATVNGTGKQSQITITVEPTATADSLSVDTTKLVPLMEEGSTQSVDFGHNYGGLSVIDQYGRTMDETDNDDYKVVATVNSSAAGIVSVTGTAELAQAITLKAGTTQGSASVTFSLYKTSDTSDANALDEVTENFTVANDVNNTTGTNVVTGYTLGSSTLTTQYASSDAATQSVFKDTDEVYGTTASGTKVLLPLVSKNGKAMIANASSSTGDFIVKPDSDNSYGASNTVDVFANGYGSSTQTTSSGVITVVVNGLDGRVYTLTANASSKNDAPTTSSIGYSVDTTVSGISTNSTTDTVTVTNASTINGKYLLNLGVNGAADVDENSPIYFYGNDQYGFEGGPITVYIGSQDLTAGNASIDPNSGLLTLSNGTSGTIELTAVSGSLQKTITLDITGTTAPLTQTDSSTLNNVATLGLVGTNAYSENSSVATAAIANGAIAITSVAQGNATIEVTNGTKAASIAVTVAANGSITINKITKYVATVTFVPGQSTNVANTTDELGLSVTAGDVVFTTSNSNIATASLSTDTTNIVIGAGTTTGDATISVSDGTNTAYIYVTVNADGSVTVNNIAKVQTIDKLVIAGVTAPVTGATPVTTLVDNGEYTATITWTYGEGVPVSGAFAAGTAYTATITIAPEANYTLTGVIANGFTVTGATATNDADTGVVTAVFPATAAA